MAHSNSKKIAIVIIILAVIAFIVAAIIHQQHAPRPIAINTMQQPTLGKPNASVHIVAFEDLKCFNCKRFTTTILPKIKENYIDKGIAKYTVINLAFVPGSMPAANAARCVYDQNEKLFFAYIDYLYEHQPAEDQDWATVPKLLEFAEKVPGIDQKKLSQCIINSPHTAFIEKNFQMARNIMPNNSVITPSIYVNGVLVKQNSYEAIAKQIEKMKS